MVRKKNLARGTEGVSEAGSGVPGGDGGATGHVTADPSSGGPEGSTVDDTGLSGSDYVTSGGDNDLDDLTVLEADDPTLGLTNIGDVPADDWAADTGPTRTAEAGAKGVSRRLVDENKTPGGKKIDVA
jgi:hypothetical protein